MRRGSAFSTIVLSAVAMAGDAEAKLDLYIDKSTQQMSVIRNGALLYAWPVSTGLDRFSTPSGVYTPERLEPIWYSKAYNVPMPHAIFFHHGYAIHGSDDITHLGGPASHGCVRLHPEEAALLFAMVEQEGPGNTTIVVGGGPPAAVLPRHRDLDEPPGPRYIRDSAIPPGAYPNPGIAPYQDPYHYVDGPERRRGDDGRSAMREAYPDRPPPRFDTQTPREPPYGADDRYRPPLPRFDAQVPMEPPPGAGGRYRPPPPPLDARVPMEPPPGAGGRYRPPPPPLDARVPMEPPPGAGGRYRPPPPPLDARVPMEPPPGAGGPNRPPPPRLVAQMPMEQTLPPPRGLGPPASRFDAQAPIEPPLAPRGRYRPPAPVTAKSNLKCPTCAPNHASDEPANRSASAKNPAKSPPPPPLSEAMQPPSAPAASAQSPWPASASARSPWPATASTQPASPPPPAAQPASLSSASPTAPTPSGSSTPTPSQSSEPQQSGSRYRVLPRSYWAGASWRWRLKVEHENSAPALTPDSQ